jgi:flagellar hook-associated protein 3 FlgL
LRLTQDTIFNSFVSNSHDTKRLIDRFTQQISSGKKINNSFEDSNIYQESLKFDSQINRYNGIVERIKKAKLITDSSDSALSTMNDSLKDMRTKLIQASNDTLTKDNLKSISISLKAQRDNLLRVANSSINGIYLFSGSAVGVKPVDERGNYHGNDKSLVVELDHSLTSEYSIDGKSLFFGVDENIQKSVVNNVQLINNDQNSTNYKKPLSTDDKIKDLFGTNDSTFYFYLNGTDREGGAVKEKISLNADDKVSDLIDKISSAYKDSVNVSYENGFIKIQDKQSGLSKLDFSMRASTQNVNSTRDLTSSLNFNRSNQNEALSGVDASTYFKKEGNRLLSNIPLIENGSIASSSTKLSQISDSSLDGKSFQMNLKDIKGVDKVVTVNLGSSSTFTLNGNSYNIYDANPDPLSGSDVPTKADDFTISQLNSIISLAMSGSVPNSNAKEDIDDAIKVAKESVKVDLSNKGELQITDLSNSKEDFLFSIYESNIDDMSSDSSLRFNSNSAVIDSDPQIDLFGDLDEIIKSVDEAIKDPGSSLKSLKNITIEGSLSKMDSLLSHISNAQSKIGAISQNMDKESQKADALKLNVTELKSNISDIDIAETIIKYQQLTLNYQAMMSTISKVNSLSLLNYIK